MTLSRRCDDLRHCQTDWMRTVSLHKHEHHRTQRTCLPRLSAQCLASFANMTIRKDYARRLRLYPVLTSRPPSAFLMATRNHKRKQNYRRTNPPRESSYTVTLKLSTNNAMWNILNMINPALLRMCSNFARTYIAKPTSVDLGRRTGRCATMLHALRM